MSAGAVTGRLREMARQLTERGMIVKGVDMSAEAVTARLKVLGALADLCRRLAPLGRELR